MTTGTELELGQWLERTDQFEELRPLLFSIAHRMLRNRSDAEDAVQESWLRYATSATDPASPRAFLCAVVTRMCLDTLRSAKARRELPVGSSEPYETSQAESHGDPASSAEHAESVSVAVLVLFQRLSPLERAVFVLREVLAFGYADIAAIVGRTEAACRQLVLRARRHLAGGRQRYAGEAPADHQAAARLAGALQRGDVAGVRALLVADLALNGDAQVVQAGLVMGGQTGRRRSHRRAPQGPRGAARRGPGPVTKMRPPSLISCGSGRSRPR